VIEPRYNAVISSIFIGKNKIVSWKNHTHTGNTEKEEIDIPIFDFLTIANATNNFPTI